MTGSAIEALRLFIPITKVDSKKRIVYGTLTQAVADKSGEIIDYPSTKAAYEKWSAQQFEASKGKSKGNLRAMHGNVAAGKFTDLVFDDENQKIEGAAYVSDDNEWKKCEDGTYTGFSHGGSYAKRWADPEDPKLTRYTPTLAEVSLVDNPCLGVATFEYIKGDGSTELRKFNHSTQEDSMTDETGSAAATETPAEVLPAEPDAPATDEATKAVETDFVKDGKLAAPSTEPEQKWIAADGSQHVKKADAVKRNLEIETEKTLAPSLAKMDALLSKTETSPAPETPVDAHTAEPVAPAVAPAAEPAADPVSEETVEKAAPVKLVKGLSEVARAAGLIQELDWFQQCLEMEADWERDNSPQPAALKAIIADLCTFLKALVAEETAELFTAEDEVIVMEMAAKMSGSSCDTLAKFVSSEKVRDALGKAGARHSAKDKEDLMAVHKSAADHLSTIEKCFKSAGIMADEDDGDKTAQKMNKVLETVNALKSENSVLTTLATKSNTMMEKAASLIEGLSKQIAQQESRIDHLEALPAPAKGYVRAVAKTQDGGTGDGNAELEQTELAKMTSEERAVAMIKIAQRNPVRQLEHR